MQNSTENQRHIIKAINNDFEEESFVMLDFIITKYDVKSLAEMTDEILLYECNRIEVLSYVKEIISQYPDEKLIEKIQWKFKLNNWFELDYEQANQVLNGLHNKYNTCTSN